MFSNQIAQSQFPHRMNKDGTIDSICRRCFATIGCSTWEADLDRIEAAHECRPAHLAFFSEQRREEKAADPPFESCDRSDIRNKASYCM